MTSTRSLILCTRPKLGSLTMNHLLLTVLGFNPAKCFGFFHLRKISSKLIGHWLFYSGANMCLNNARKGLQGLPPQVKAGKVTKLITQKKQTHIILKIYPSMYMLNSSDNKFT